MGIVEVTKNHLWITPWTHKENKETNEDLKTYGNYNQGLCQSAYTGIKTHKISNFHKPLYLLKEGKVNKHFIIVRYC